MPSEAKASASASMSVTPTAEAPAQAQPSGARRLEILAAESQVPAHVLAGVMAHRRWDSASQVAPQDLQTAIDEVAAIRLS